MKINNTIMEQDLLTDLFFAYFCARKNKRNTSNQLKFEIDYEKNLIELYHAITSRRYQVSPSICFVVDYPVKREIFAADFRDRVIHHLLFNYINSYLENDFIDDSYSCRKGKGTLFGIRRVEQFIKECSVNYTQDCYVLKLDICGYFMSINKKILRQQLYSIVDAICMQTDYSKSFDRDLILYLIDKILDDDPTCNCHIKGSKEDWIGFHRPKVCLMLHHSMDYLLEI